MRIIYWDLKLEAIEGRLDGIVGRVDDMKRLTRIINRRIHNNCFIVGPSGIGKTALIHGWIKKLVFFKEFHNKKFIQLNADSFLGLGDAKKSMFGFYQEILAELPSGVLFIDNFNIIIQNQSVFYDFTRLLKPFLESSDFQVVLSCGNQEYKEIEEKESAWLNFFETVNLKNQPFNEQVKILAAGFKKIMPERTAAPSKKILELIINKAERFSILGQLPSSAIKLLDESLSQAKIKNKKELNEIQVDEVIADKTGIPLNQLRANEKEMLRNLESDLNGKIIGQKQAIRRISSTIQRAKLGLRNHNRPLGSFLILGPSGVGKTETAKILAAKIFGRQENFVRIDMSEFGQEHTVQRLIGAPPGYIGYDAGGGLTNPVKSEPYSLILLDEIEKAHPKVFDIFLQILDDGRLTSGQGETIDFTQTIIMATSNLAVTKIIKGFQAGEDIHSEKFLKLNIIPALTKAFRPEFINRFDGVIIFNPLIEEVLLTIAQMEIKKIEKRISKHNFKFTIDQEILSKKIKEISDFRFGARPVKRFVEDICETLITNNLLK